MSQHYVLEPENFGIIPVACSVCGWSGKIEGLVKEYTLKQFGFEMYHCPDCSSERKKTKLPLVLVSYTGGFQGVRGCKAIPPTLTWRIGSGEKRFY